ncbi:hypothetical protein BJM39_24700 [Salmonella enterica subsp. enterica serovar Javiana]|nr:hypothetical protein BJM39_24700 [Salmonella enterica subsp. enterica serovar Javiana]
MPVKGSGWLQARWDRRQAETRARQAAEAATPAELQRSFTVKPWVISLIWLLSVAYGFIRGGGLRLLLTMGLVYAVLWVLGRAVRRYAKPPRS